MSQSQAFQPAESLPDSDPSRMQHVIELTWRSLLVTDIMTQRMRLAIQGINDEMAHMQPKHNKFIPHRISKFVSSLLPVIPADNSSKIESIQAFEDSIKLHLNTALPSILANNRVGSYIAIMQGILDLYPIQNAQLSSYKETLYSDAPRVEGKYEIDPEKEAKIAQKRAELVKDLTPGFIDEVLKTAEYVKNNVGHNRHASSSMAV